ncbi:MAG: WYL domain-containing protein [Tannerellaceae bacterium]|nr:WYL domain-containing protein [Tannerellaceae bacterium]
MPANRNALIRYKTIDNCLQNRYRQWTLDDLIDACSDALCEYEGIDKGISRRTIQADIQVMRSEKLGYNAPIVVYDNKYYKYDDPDYSITNTPLTEQDLNVLSEAVEVMKQFKGFSHFHSMTDIVSRLEDHITSVRQKTIPVIDFEKNESLKGLEHLDAIYQAIINRQTLSLQYRSFKACSDKTFIYYPYLLKEYRNRWFVFGVTKEDKMLTNFALDRIQHLETAHNEPFLENTFFDVATFFDDLVGVSKTLSSQPEVIRFRASREEAPYILTKPIHKSQHVVKESEEGDVVFEIEVIINIELQRIFLGSANEIQILSPQHLVDLMKEKLEKAAENYKTPVSVRDR